MSRTTSGGELRRQQILDAAADVIAERGLCDARIADVASLAGTSPALVIYYFPTKDQLLAEALEHEDRSFVTRITAIASGPESPAEKLRLLVESSCPRSSGDAPSNRSWALWFAMWTRARLDEELAGRLMRQDETWRATVASVIREGQATGEFGAADAATVAQLLTALIDGLAIQVMLGNPALDGDRMLALCLDLVAVELGTALMV